jgi:hypothetical protein
VPGRWGRMSGSAIRACVLALAVIALVGGPTAADQPAQLTDTHPCQGILNAYAHAADAALGALQAVADRLGCDVSGVERVAKPDHPANADEPDTGDADTPDDAGAPDDAGPPDQAGAPDNAGPPDQAGPDVAAKCTRIADKLTAAQARPHGKSADAFSRMADRWGCPVA